MGRNGRQTRAAIVRAATAERQAGRTPTLQSISDAVGISTATVYHHFHDGLGDVDRAIAVAAARDLTACMDAAAAEAIGVEAADAVIEAGHDWVRANAPLFDLLQQHAAHAHVWAAWQDVAGPLAAIVDDHGGDGDLVGAAFVAALVALAARPAGRGELHLLRLVTLDVHSRLTSSVS